MVIAIANSTPAITVARRNIRLVRHIFTRDSVPVLVIDDDVFKMRVFRIGPVRATSILAAWAEQKAVREIMVFLHSHGVGTARAVRIFKTYGSDAIQVMTENPYRLARDIRGIGFKTADAIAMKLGIEKAATIRVRAGISYALTEAMDGGALRSADGRVDPAGREAARGAATTDPYRLISNCRREP